MTLLLPALLWDLVLGEPPTPLHPVVWMGKLISRAEAFAPASNFAQLLWGGAVTLTLVGLSVGIGVAATMAPQPWGTLFGIFLLKSSFSLQELLASGERVARALEASDLEQAREQVGRIVSRSVADLDEPKIAAAAVQSVSENLSDSVVAPLFYFALFGLPGALAYRAVNTMDAMIGYRGRYEYLGKVAARLDDLMNYVPARLTALLLLLMGSASARPGWRVWWRDRRATASPNGGHPMAAAAGILGVQLEKVGHYRLGDGAQPGAVTIVRMNRYALALALVVAAFTGLVR